MLDEKSMDISKVKTQLNEFLEQNSRLVSEKQQLGTELDIVREGRKANQREIDRLLNLNERLALEQSKNTDQIKDYEMQIMKKNRNIGEGNDNIKSLLDQKRDLEVELDIAREGRRSNQKELDRMILTSNKLAEEKNREEERVKDYAHMLSKLEQKVDDSNFLYVNKEKELTGVKEALNYAEDKNAESRLELKKLHNDKSTLEQLTVMHKKEADVQKMMREEELNKNLQLSTEKKRLERNLMDKELEAYTVKRELDKIAEEKDATVGIKDDLEREVDALRDHMTLLSSQNQQVLSF
jgi:chromosome segregation ATPase